MARLPSNSALEIVVANCLCYGTYDLQENKGEVGKNCTISRNLDHEIFKTSTENSQDLKIKIENFGYSPLIRRVVYLNTMSEFDDSIDSLLFLVFQVTVKKTCPSCSRKTSKINLCEMKQKQILALLALAASLSTADPFVHTGKLAPKSSDLFRVSTDLFPQIYHIQDSIMSVTSKLCSVVAGVALVVLLADPLAVLTKTILTATTEVTSSAVL